MSPSSFLIMFGIVMGLVVTASLYSSRKGTITAPLALYVIGFILSVLMCRFLHWYSSSTTYESLIQAFTDFSVGTFCPSGIVLGALIAGAVVGRLPFCEDKDILMDCAAPGFLLMFIFIRLSAWGTGKCQGGKNVNSSFFQRLPFSIRGVDAAGNTYYRFATFLISALLFTAAFVFILRFYNRTTKRKMFKPASRYGNVWRLTLLLYAAIEIVLDSTRIDSMHFTFRKILTLNRFSTFISIGQIVPFFILVFVFAYYCKCSARIYGFSVKEIISIVLFVVSVFFIGFLGEYKWQRVGFYRSYLFMTIGALIITAVVFVLYEGCVKRKKIE